MVIRIWRPCIVLSCIVIPCLFAKPFSLNEAIAAEERQKALQTTQRPKFVSETSERFSLNRVLRPKLTDHVKSKKFKLTGTSERISLNKALRSTPVKSKKETEIFPRGKKISSLQYRKTFQVKSPLKPNNLKNLKARHRRRNQSIKREINEDDKINKRYIPLLRSLSLLFDNILAKSGDSIETTRTNLRKSRQSKRNKTECTCTDRLGKDVTDTESPEETVVSTTPVVEITTIEPTQLTTTEAPTTTTDNASLSDVSDLGPNTDVPTILPRDTTSTRRDHFGVSERSSATFHASTEGNISGDNGDSERYTTSRKHKPRSETNEEDTDSASREHASSLEFRGRGDRSDFLHPVYRGRIDENTSAKRKSDESARQDGGDNDKFQGQVNSKRKDGLRYFGRDVFESEGENKLKIRGDETEGPRVIQQFVRGDRRFVSEDSVNNNTESIQPQEDHEEGIVGIAHYIANDQRLSDGDGTFATEDQKDGAANTALISIKDLNNPIIMLQNSPKHKAPFVTIIDGYSVARDKNGASKLTEQSLRFRS